jgi:tetratricopeptide (TPR) repeat protein
VYQALNQFPAAIQDFNKTIELNPGLAIAYFNRGRAYKAMGNKEAARQDFQQAAELGIGAGEGELRKL